MQKTLNLRPVIGFIASAAPWVLAPSAVAMALFMGNIFAMAVCAIAALWTGVATENPVLVKHFGLDWYSQHERKAYFRNRRDFWIVIGAPLCAALASLCIFVPWPWYSYAVVDRGEEISYHTRLSAVVVNPLTVKIRYFFDVYSLGVGSKGSTDLLCQGQTADRRGVVAHIGARLSLPFENLPDAYRQAGSTSRLQELLNSELCQRFATVLSTYAIDSIPSTLSIASRSADERRGMERLGLQYSGTLYVGNLNAYVTK